MKKIIVHSLGIIAVLIFCYSSYAETIYRWADKDGKRHFSDIPSKLTRPLVFTSEPLAIITLVKSKALKALPKTKRSNRRATGESKSERCAGLRNEILALDEKLRQKLPAEKFDQIRQQFDLLNWKKTKSC